MDSAPSRDTSVGHVLFVFSITNNFYKFADGRCSSKQPSCAVC